MLKLHDAEVEVEPVTHGGLREFAADPLGCMRRLRAEYGDLFAIDEHGRRIVFALGPEYNQLLLSDSRRFHSQFFVMRGGRASAQRRITGGLLSMNGDEHRGHRRMLKEPFQKRSIGLYHDTITGLATEMLDDWRVGDVVDVNGEMLRFMLRLTSSILFGLDVPDLAIRIGEKIDRWMHQNHATGVGAFLREPSFEGGYQRLLAGAEDLEHDLRELIELRRGEGSAGRDVLSLLLRATEGEGMLDDEQLCGHVALLFAAAHLTTAHSLTWTLLLLAQHPEAAAECFAESRQAGADRGLDEKLAERCPSMERVVKESMRLLPASAYVQRVCAEPVDLGPFRLERGTPIVWSQFMTHHMERVFPNPHRFDPDRWRTARPSAYEYLPFGAGNRMCIGAPIALHILRTVLPMIVGRFRLNCVAGTRIDPRVVSTTFGPAGPLPMHVGRPDGRFESAHVVGRIHDLVELPTTISTRRAG